MKAMSNLALFLSASRWLSDERLSDEQKKEIQKMSA
jgi:hypothetical protein